ncbi:RCC1 domain-containing protein [Bifidobacterium polysaccharolyticum]|uniref:RCC1 domain-containing protein n=1 Tax=Bifidobacterium polysaccharolyticum TaxID=2750967 RepID=UPI0021BB1A4B|nr:InlB B-repeat-containing protein [Bifidobacterium polysaccharolyticum]MCT8157981.1 InlB B-repeat-containing protein [Bifidobacterium polysaccharolyticum]
MRLVSRLRRVSAMMLVLLSLLAGLATASSNADDVASAGPTDAPANIGRSLQTPGVAEQTPAALPSNGTDIPLTSPSPIQATPSTTDSPDSTSDKTDNQAAHVVRFDPADGSKPTQKSVKTGTLASPPEHNPVRDGFRFNGWTHDGQPFDLQTPILQDITLKARWTKVTDWTLSPDHGPASGARLAINPPDKQEPRFSNIHAAGEQTVGLTGDGSIYTWTKDSTPKQVPSPAYTAEGFHYLQATAGSQWRAALGSDQHIYTWTSQQATPTILDTGHNTHFTSISINDDRLLAVDEQGRVHAYHADQASNQDQTPEFTQQAATGLPGQTQAVTTAASDKRILILDADGQTWTWKTASGNARPSRIEQEPGMRIIQAQALNKGFLLLDADGQAQYLNDSSTKITAASLPESMKARSITTNGSQAIINGTDGQVWTWKPGNKPERADDGSQTYMQASEADGRITAISRQGSLYQWKLDEQGQPGKPTRTNTTQAPILETASMDGQPLKLSKTSDAWQTDMPAHKPGPASITITGKQYGQPFTRRLNYTVDQTLTRDTTTDTTHTVTFDTGEGNTKPEDQQVPYPYGRAKRPSPDPTRNGYQFDGWFTGNTAYDFSKPVTENITLTAHWTSKNPRTTWTISPDRGSQFGNETTTITPPDSASGVKFNQISNSIGSGKMHNSVSLAVGSDGNAYAWGDTTSGQLGNGTTTTTKQKTPVPVKKPAGVSDDFTYVQVSAGYRHSLALGSDGYVYAWGDNTYAQLGNNTTGGYSVVPVRVCDPSTHSNVNTGLKAIQVDAGGEHSLAVDKEGNVWAWGRNDYGQLGNGTSSKYSSTPVRVCDPEHPTDASKGLVAIKVAAGGAHSLAIDKNGDTWAWGFNSYGQLGNGTSSGFNGANPVPGRVRDPNNPDDTSKSLKSVQISAGFEHSMAIDAQGNTWSWGWNYWGELGQNTKTDRIFVPTQVYNPDNPSIAFKASQVSAGYDTSLAIDINGVAWSWGRNDYGQLGYTNYDSSTVHRQPAKVRNPASPNNTDLSLNSTLVSAGNWDSLAIGKDGYTYAWGYNGYGQLGNNSYKDAYAPVLVEFNLSRVISAARFDSSPGTNLTNINNSNSVTVLTPAHVPGTVTVSVDYTMGGSGQTLTDTSLRYTYLSAGVLPRAGGEGIMLALATGMTGMGAMLASRRHRREQHRLLHALHE